MSMVDVLIPLIGGVVLTAFPDVLTSKVAPPEEAAKRRKKLRTIGFVLLGVAFLYFCLSLAQPLPPNEAAPR